MLSPSLVSFVVDANTPSIPAGARVKLVTPTTVTLAGVADVEIGTAILHGGKDAYSAGDGIGIVMAQHPGTRICKASGAIPALTIAKRAANGLVTAGGVGDNYVIAFEDAADGDWFEGLTLPALLATVADAAITTPKLGPAAVTGAKLDPAAYKYYVVSGVDASGGAADIAIAGVLATDRVVEVVDLTTPAALSVANFTPGAGKITQAQAAGNLSTKKLHIRTLPAAS